MGVNRCGKRNNKLVLSNVAMENKLLEEEQCSHEIGFKHEHRIC